MMIICRPSFANSIMLMFVCDMITAVDKRNSIAAIT